MPHLFLPLRQPTALEEYRRQLAAAHDAVARAAADHQVAVASIDHWGCVAKRRPVDLSAVAADPAVHGLVGVASQPFAEILNQLATVERLLDVLAWSARVGAVHVIECNPSTSRGPVANCSHDLVVRGAGLRIVVEVSDVAGEIGNANRKMEKDLATLDRCRCGDTSARRILAVSPQSARWLQARAGRVSVLEAGEGDGTWIFESVAPRPAVRADGSAPAALGTPGPRPADVVEAGVERARAVLAAGDSAVAGHLLHEPPNAVERLAGVPGPPASGSE